jgi:hypothetical protein
MKMFFLAHAQYEESPRSVLIRTARENGFESVSAMARQAGSKESLQPISWQLQRSKLIQELGLSTNLNGEKFIESFYRQDGRTTESPITLMGLQVPAEAIRPESFTYCCDCAKQGIYYSIQDLVWLSSCPYHDRAYGSNCPSCEQPIRWTHLRGKHCRCGFDLSKGANTHCQSKASHLLLDIFRTKDQPALDRFIFALRALRYSKSTSHSIQTVEMAARIATCDDTALDELLAEARRQFPCLPIRPLAAVWMTSSDEWIKSQVSRLLTTYASIGPASGQCNCSNLRLNQDEMCQALNVSVKKLRSLLTRDFVQREKHRKTRWIYSSKNLCGLLENHSDTATLKSQVENLGTSIQQGDLLSIEAVATLLGVYPEAVRNAIACGFMSAALQQGGYRRIMINRHTANEFNSDFVFIGQLANDLSLPRTTLSAKLLHLGVKPISGPVIDGGLVTIYRRSDIDEDLQQKLRDLDSYKTNAGRKSAAARREISSSGEHIFSTTVARALGVSLHDLKHLERLGYLVRADANKITRCYTSTSVSVTKSVLAGMLPLKSFSDETAMSPPTFSKRFLQSGYLEHIRVGKKILIPSQQLALVKEHRRLFLSFCEADELLGTPFGHSANLAKTGRLKPVAETEQGYVPTVRLLHRSDIDKIK